MILDAIVFAIVLGVTALVVAERLRLPAILPLLLLGMAAGPAGLGWFDPHHLGGGLEVLIHVAVAVILFEGGLSLNLAQLSRVGAAVRNLLTLGAAVTTLLAAVLAKVVVGMPWTTALLFGAIVMVTGPTAIAPLLRHMIAPRRVKVILTSEGLIIDAIGATVAYFVLQWVERAGLPVDELATQVLKLALVGVVCGAVGGLVARFLSRSRLVGVEVRNPMILGLLMLTYIAAEHLAPQSGILASVVMGVAMAMGNLPDLARIKMFKGQLTILLIAVVFVLLAAQLDLATMTRLGWRGLLVVGALILVVRPLSVFLSIWPRHLGLRERIALSLTAPRGIVAAAVASLSALSLREAGVGGAASLEGLVYLVILVTCAWATLMAMVLPRALGYVNDPSRRRAVLVGAHRLTEILAGVLQRSGRSVVVIDAVPWRLDRFRDAGHTVVVGDARDAASYEQAGLERDSLLVAATTNDELNLLVGELAHHEFGVEHPVIALQSPPEDFGTRSRAWADLLGTRGVDLAAWIRRLENERVQVLDVPLGGGLVEPVREIDRKWPKEALVLCGWRGDEVTFRFDLERPGALTSVTMLVCPGRALEQLREYLPPEPATRPSEEAPPAEEVPAIVR